MKILQHVFLTKTILVIFLMTIPTEVGFAQETTPLHEAAKTGNATEVWHLLSGGARPNSIRYEGDNTPLILATAGGHVDVMEILLLNGAKANFSNADGITPLGKAAEIGHIQAVEMLLAHGAKASAGIYSAIKHGHADVVQILLNNGVNLNKEFGSYFESPLFWAVRHRHVDVVEMLLLSGADPNIAGGDFDPTVLHVAAERGYAGVAQVLLEHGAKQDIRSRIQVRYYDGDGGYSSKYGGYYTDEQKFGGRFPIHQAAANGHANVISVLINGGANPNAGDIRGLDPLYFSIKGKHADAVKALLIGGANPNQAWGKRLLNWAKQTRDDEIIEALLEAGIEE